MKWSWVSTTTGDKWMSGVKDTGDKPLDTNISTNFRKKFQIRVFLSLWGQTGKVWDFTKIFELLLAQQRVFWLVHMVLSVEIVQPESDINR